ncbi:heavy metal translocating P-type ATPase [Deinococcus radiodurans]|jgi:heavy metal-(Cd/Co/Hg/Pb/Zn)-translocating P-type ATPase|uniref:Cation-transporting P-type ATPase n=1 Tax=Deinococcus radiodurans (strain ATCC 13939 / DSM 20539 / JCM 16871 / CCUG 27074 / LMG 4051 / NBRC 15346 / NCIMB 9279 / VKM B-1422 / R1) TaxID=243230 RepID=Q9RZ81_DEIRA|nr:heavy metal translocating P-type ATPase [Deinococcus radiodurans]AAF12244.1 cation-transporting P-type ATPase [Deinococcus radiodurans R1 = ATCC 13939 = DSM 20539]ANC72933.1 ATPase [Deinococcus radiodurans R1 = ATCC 13939 = DSM 20539]QEM72891.1 cadmium-translocating P-type ATPase [Deinococcus radiodurans]QIP30431.1 cadmium-translocating P-type ATPase [Deinococcus radiodurans]QIP33210.1 cadmium-translocating P-type ATPase [Deinococcus radiodurans]
MEAHGTRLSYFVEGMDCANCVARVEKMVGGLPGTGEVKTSFTRQTLTLELDETQTSRAALEKNLRSLGYGPSLLPDRDAPQTGEGAHTHDHADHQHAGHSHSHDPAEQGKPWYRTGQGQLVVASGVLLALAWVFGRFEPAWAQWGYAAAALLGAWPLAKKAWASVRLGDPFSINLLVTLAAIGAVAIGQAAEGAVVVFLFAVGELLEGVAAGRARAGIATLAALAPKTALLVEPGGVREVPADTLQVGQTVQVGPGARVPADGTITAGQSSLDDSPVTGESVPVSKGPGDHVYAGSINTDGVLTVRVDRAAADNTIARIIHLVEEAESSKAPTARFIDRFSRWYTPGVVAVAALTAALPPLLLGQPWYPWLYKGIALLLIGCPCALVLSVPAAITSGISAGTRRGLLIKGGAALETIGSVRTIAFDKTGTLTSGRPRVTDVLADNPAELLRLAAAVETGSSHPLAQAITAEAQARGLTVPAASEARALPGQGVTALVEGRPVQVTSPIFAASQATLSAEQQQTVATLEQQGRTVVVGLDGGRVLGLIALRDEPREDAREALAELRRLGIRPLMLTGDNARTGQAVAADLGLDVQAELLPADKLNIIDELRAQGGVAMVGDGINDAPALARADVGIAMGSGTDVALETADAALLRGQVQGVGELVQLSRDTLANIRQNVAFALGLKAIFLVTTLLGYTNLWMAVLADTGATAIVTANALRLLNWRPRHA